MDKQIFSALSDRLAENGQYAMARLVTALAAGDMTGVDEAAMDALLDFAGRDAFSWSSHPERVYLSPPVRTADRLTVVAHYGDYTQEMVVDLPARV